MREVKGDMWKYLGRKHFLLCVTTNGYVKRTGEGVMGRGNALQAAEMFPELPKLLGRSIKTRGNVVSRLTKDLYSFPVKHAWFQAADKKLVRQSAKQLRAIAESMPTYRFILPRPGVGNGNLKWEEVKPLLKDLPDSVMVITND